MPDEELGGEIPDVADLDLVRSDPDGVQRPLGRLADQIGQRLPFAGEVAGKIGLEAAEEIDGIAGGPDAVALHEILSRGRCPARSSAVTHQV